MKGNWLFQRGVIQFITLNLLVAIAYAICVNLSQEFATLPATVASVWFPSGMTLALVYLLGNRGILGIACGATYTLILSLFKINSTLPIFSLLLIVVACTCGNVLQPLIATYLIKKFARHKHIFSHVNTVVLYIAAAIFAPTVSATLGITSLAVTGLIEWQGYGISWATWWLGSALPHLIFTPTILLWKALKQRNIQIRLREIILVLILFLCVSWISFIQGYPLAYLLLPILIWTVFRYGSFWSSVLVSMVSLIAILSTAQGHGLYIKGSPNDSLLLLQSFMAVFALTSLILSAVIDERTEAELLLKQAMESLEFQVVERTAELQQSESNLKQANLELKKLVNLDGLTQIANRRCFDYHLELEWERLYREQQPMSLLLFDIDYFKRYNDCYGHPMGDECLIKIAQTAKEVLFRPADLLARYGGEEFAVILPNTDVKGASIVAEQIRIAIANLNIDHQNSSIEDIVTISLGVASLLPNSLQDHATLLQQADIALYIAKQCGRNRSVVFTAI
jgi:diguanylate cyclase (GGDEF)-like protein